MRPGIARFMKQQGLQLDVDLESFIANFHEEMTRGLSGQRSSLAMLPSFIQIRRDIPAGVPVIALDVGGTRMRLAEVVFDNEGEPKIEFSEEHAMPGSDTALNRDDFFLRIAERLLPVIDNADKIGFCFSYPTEILPDRDGRLLKWTKEIDAPEVVGEPIVRNLKRALGPVGANKHITILNDSTAVLLAGTVARRVNQTGGYVGFILGTGTNSAYEELNSAILKTSGLDPARSQIVNIESGNLAIAARGKIDEILDATTDNPGEQRLEKMISGAYLGRLCRCVLISAAAESLFSPDTSKRIQLLGQLSSIDVSSFLEDPDQESDVSRALANKSDRDLAALLFTQVIERAALLTAMHISAVVLKTNSGESSIRPFCITVDGSTYHETPRLRFTVERLLQEMLGSRGIFYEPVQVPHAPIIGAAIAALTQ